MMISIFPRRRVENLVRRPQDRRRRMTVESLEGRQLLSTFSVSNEADSGAGTLRQAIINSDAPPPPPPTPTSSPSTASNVVQIQLQSQLPTITQPVIIDGTTANSYNGNHPFVQLIGNYARRLGARAGHHRIRHAGQGTGHRRVFNAGGVLIDNASNVMLTDDYVGLDTNANATGPDVNGNTIYEGNGVYGVTIQSENGGSATGNLLSNDIVSANVYNGIILSGLSTTQERGQRHDHRVGQHRRGRRGRPGQRAGQRPARRRRQRRRHQPAGHHTTPSAGRRPPPATSSWATRATASTSPTATRTTTSSRATSSAPTSPACTRSTAPVAPTATA